MTTETISRVEVEAYLNSLGATNMTKKAIHNAAKAVNKLDLWDWFRTYEPPSNKGFMWDEHENIDLMANETKGEGHSGASFGLTLRYIQQIAKDRVNFPKKFVPTSRFPCQLL